MMPRKTLLVTARPIRFEIALLLVVLIGLVGSLSSRELRAEARYCGDGNGVKR